MGVAALSGFKRLGALLYIAPVQLLGPEFFARDTLKVAPDLLGKLVFRELDGRRYWGRLVEVEAYCGPEDRMAHSWRGLTPRTRPMFGPPGHAYVYVSYGMHRCLNFVTQPEGVPQAVLVRALEPGPGLGRCSGPGLVCRELQIVDTELSGVALVPPDIYVMDDGYRPRPGAIAHTKRIGMDYSNEWGHRPWRFCLPSPHLSRPLPRRRA